MNSADLPHFNGQFCSFIAYLCGCGKGCGHMAWLHVLVVMYNPFQGTKMVNCLMGHKSWKITYSLITVHDVKIPVPYSDREVLLDETDVREIKACIVVILASFRGVGYVLQKDGIPYM